MGGYNPYNRGYNPYNRGYYNRGYNGYKGYNRATSANAVAVVEIHRLMIIIIWNLLEIRTNQFVVPKFSDLITIWTRVESLHHRFPSLIGRAIPCIIALPGEQLVLSPHLALHALGPGGPLVASKVFYLQAFHLALPGQLLCVHHLDLVEVFIPHHGRPPGHTKVCSLL